MTTHDTAFQFAAANIRFGSGITGEVGEDLNDLGARRTMVVIDPAVRDSSTGETVLASLKAARVDFEVYDQVVVEPTDASFQAATAAARAGKFDSFVAVGGGSTIDTAKAANLYSTHAAAFFDFVNAPIGRGLPIPGPLKPLIAIPTTAGTGSETTGVAIFDYVEKHAKTGIAHRYLKPTLGIVDSDNTRHQPAAVAASAGLDVLSHALESYTAIPYTSRPRPARPLERGPLGLWSSSTNSCSARLTTRQIPRPAATCCWRRRSRDLVSATRVCTCRMGCPTR
jgi:hydroxyacid-oxoacid transhydrogenase